jgi:hypothetical protein
MRHVHLGAVGARVVVALLVGSAALSMLARPAAAQCDVDVSGNAFDLNESRRPSDALRVNVDDDVTVVRPDDGVIVATLWFGPLPVPLPAPGNAGDTVTIPMRDYSWLGVGLYRVDVFGPGAGDCAGTFWVRVGGRFPLLTAGGVAASLITVAGIALASSAVRRGRRGRCSIVRGVISGIVLGTGVAGLGQQFAVLPALLPIVVAALVLPAIVMGVIARRACAVTPVPVSLMPFLVAPAVVAIGRQFEVRLGVGATESTTAKRSRPHEVTAQIVTGAAVVEGGPWRRRLSVSANGQPAELTVRMRATRNVGEANLTVLYSAGGQTVGVARRHLWVVPSGQEAHVPPVGATEATPFRLPVEQPAADLELRATYVGPRAQNLMQWTVESPHALALPDAPIEVDLGHDPEQFAATLLAEISEGDGHAGLAELLLGAGRQLARTLDPTLIGLVQGVLTRPGEGLPRVLLLTEEAAIPWELVAIEPAPESTPPFLATRAVVGRWYLDPGTPTLPPPVASGSGPRSVLATAVLPAALQERDRLVARFGFAAVNPTVAEALDAFERSGVVHLACHGSWKHQDDRFFLELNDGHLTPTHIAGLHLDQRPFVFLNACQVASGGESLGTPTGFPAELVFAGVGGCVAPLWSVRDDQAFTIAVAFYDGALAGRSPAEVIHEQRLRAAFDGLMDATPFAYQFIGHPSLLITSTPSAPAHPVIRTTWAPPSPASIVTN